MHMIVKDGLKKWSDLVKQSVSVYTYKFIVALLLQ